MICNGKPRPHLILLVLFCLSCTPILQNTVGRHVYAKNYRPLPATGRSFYTEIPYEIFNGWIVVTVTLNQHATPYKFLFDTGARSFIRDSVALELGLVPVAYKKSSDVNQHVTQVALYKVDLALGGVNMNGLGILSKNNFDSITNGCFPLDGILGANILDEGVFHLDADRHVLVFTHSMQNIPQEKRTLRTKLYPRWNGESLVKLTVHNRTRKFIFDTGSANFLLVEPTLARKENLVKVRTAYRGALHSAVTSEQTFYTAPQVTLGRHERTRLTPSLLVSYPNADNNLGSRLLEQYSITLDRSHKKFYLVPAKRPAKETVQAVPNLQLKWSSGVVRVSALTRQGALQQAGLHLNDTVLAMNAVPVAAFKDACAFESHRDSLLSTIATRHLVLTMKHGTTAKIYTVTRQLLYE